MQVRTELGPREDVEKQAGDGQPNRQNSEAPRRAAATGYSPESGFQPSLRQELGTTTSNPMYGL